MTLYPDSVAGIANALATRDISSVEITRHYIERINALDGQINSYVTVCEAHALDQAQAADDLISRGHGGPLTGVPYAHKDIFCTKGIRTSCGSRMLDNFISPYDATVTERLNNAGMVLLGKTNMDEFAMGSSNETSFYGPVTNPWKTGAVPGGSSGGSAAAVAARLAPCATGTDTGGSIRQPAALCGITGLKPTYGRVSRYGMIAFASSLDQGGPMATNALDCALLTNVIAGFDRKDSTSVDHPTEDYSATLSDSIKGLRCGIPKQYFGKSLDSKVASAIRQAVSELENLGAQCVEVDLPSTELAIPSYYVISSAECSSNLSRYDGVRFGYRCDNPVDLEDMYTRTRGEGFGKETKRRILIGTYALSSGYYDAYYTKAQQIRRLIQQDFKKALAEVDVLVGPTSPTTAFEIGQKSSDPISMYLSDIYTTAVNLAGLPALSMPAGFVDGLPVGLQIIGDFFSESKLLQIAHQYQQVTDWHVLAPPLGA
ncbi:MAG: aspartyl-tRNA(Asn)/glutamyl-tRNA(Gln) amidotransferase subunit A [Gammaproteobacteria bacterium]|jgi:aspartyl-tRNA(Asn)/glutamyl-tRNA(Gln) amidotransferase subunit A